MINFGNKGPNIIKYTVVGLVLSFTVLSISQCTKIKENIFWDLLDEIQRKYFPQKIINDFIIKDSEKLNRRIQRDVDKAIYNVIPEYDKVIKEYDKVYKPRYSEEKNDETICYTDECKALSPPMRICAPWVENCTKS